MIPRNLIFWIAAILVASFSATLFGQASIDSTSARQAVSLQAANGNATAQNVIDVQPDPSQATQENAQLPGTGSDWFGYVVAGALLLVLAGFFKRSAEQG